MLLELGIVVSQLLWYWRTRAARGAAKRAGLSYDRFVEMDARKDCPSGAVTDPAAVTDLEVGDAVGGGGGVRTGWLRGGLLRKGDGLGQTRSVDSVVVKGDERGIAMPAVPVRAVDGSRGEVVVVERSRALEKEPWVGVGLDEESGSREDLAHGEGLVTEKDV
jgi:hypothetical protein